MPIDPQQTIYYKRARFTTRLPRNYRYAPSHFWMVEEEDGVFRVGLTKFSTRMLGDFVELSFDVSPGDTVEAGQAIGCIEGFKAVSDLYCVTRGQFAGANEALAQDPSLLDRDPYDSGWLYRIRGSLDESIVDVHGYVELLDATIDRMLDDQQQEPKEKSC